MPGVVGFTVPARTPFTIDLNKSYTIPGDKPKGILPFMFKVSAVTTGCAYGKGTTLDRRDARGRTYAAARKIAG